VELRRRDIQIQAVGAELRCSAPAGALTPELRAQLARYKSDVLQLLSAAQALAAQARAVVPLQAGGTRTPIYGVPGHNGDVFCYRGLARALGDDQPFFGLQPPGLDGEREPLRSVEELAAYLAEQVRASRPHGACIVAGFCAGGAVAFDLAQQLARGGADVRWLALFGSPYPVYFTRRAQLWQGLRRQAQRFGKHAAELAARPWSARRRYLDEELRQRRARLEEERARLRDPVLERRAKVERATVAAVRRYRPRHFDGRVNLFLPGPEWLRSGVAALRWRSVAARAEVHFGPEASNGRDMLRGGHAVAFAALFRSACEEAE
jgi:thioesterase domain-containing protein